MYREYKDQDQYDVSVMVHRIVLELQIFNYWSLRETPLPHMRMFMYNYGEKSRVFCVHLPDLQIQ